MRMPFGKYMNWDIRDIPRGYLRWVVKNTTLPERLEQGITAVIEGRPIPKSIDEQLEDIIGKGNQQ